MEEPEFGPPRGLALAGPGRAGTRVWLCSRRKQIKQPGLFLFFFLIFTFTFFFWGGSHTLGCVGGLGSEGDQRS